MNIKKWTGKSNAGPVYIIFYIVIIQDSEIIMIENEPFNAERAPRPHFA